MTTETLWKNMYMTAIYLTRDAANRLKAEIKNAKTPLLKRLREELG